MSKILKDSTYNELKSKADAFDLIMSKVDASEDGGSIEEQANLIIQVMEDATEPLHTDSQNELIDILQAKIEDLNATINVRNVRIAELETELDDIPGDAPATISSKEEPTAKPDTLLDFANRNAGNTEAILAKLKEEGLL